MFRIHSDHEDFHKASSLSSWLFMKYNISYKTFRQKSKLQYINESAYHVGAFIFFSFHNSISISKYYYERRKSFRQKNNLSKRKTITYDKKNNETTERN